MLDDFLLGWVEFVELLHKMLALHLVELLPADLYLLERSECLSEFGAA